jgi:hypothetical protein
MIKRLLAMSCCVILSAASAADVLTTVKTDMICGPTEVILSTLIKNYQEQLVWKGTGTDGGYAMMVNEKSGTWTLLYVAKEQTCVVGAGNEHNMIDMGTKI